jgi:hypothetical protein
MTTTADALGAVAKALDDLAGALASGVPDRVLAAEEPLVRALGGLRQARPGPDDTRAQLRVARRHVALAIARCQRLGRVSADLERLLSAPVYRPAGAHPAMTMASSRRAVS